jgi:trk system potassium uptake protein TrkA
MAEFAVIGMGRFGRAVARNLARLGESVLAVDRDPKRLALVAGQVDSTVTADTTNERVVSALQLHRMASVVVAIGSHATEASLLTTAILKEQGIAQVVARSFDDRHGRLLLAVGANEVVNPEDEMGHRLATRLAHPTILDHFAFAEATVAEVEVPEEFVGRSLAALDLRNRFDVTVLAIQRRGKASANPPLGEALQGGDVLVLLGRQDAIERVAARK